MQHDGRKASGEDKLPERVYEYYLHASDNLLHEDVSGRQRTAICRSETCLKKEVLASPSLLSIHYRPKNDSYENKIF